MKLLIDTNVLLDVFLIRQPFFDASSKMIALAEQGKVEAWLCGTTVTTIHYLLSKALNSEDADKYVGEILKIFHIAPITRAVLEGARESGFKDFEDAVIYKSAQHANLDAVITRNQKDFNKSDLPIYSPDDFLNMISSLGESK